MRRVVFTPAGRPWDAGVHRIDRCGGRLRHAQRSAMPVRT